MVRVTQPPRHPSRPIVRRDADGNPSLASSWESLTERLIREAQVAGQFEGLPGHGRPLHVSSDAGSTATTS